MLICFSENIMRFHNFFIQWMLEGRSLAIFYFYIVSVSLFEYLTTIQNRVTDPVFCRNPYNFEV